MTEKFTGKKRTAAIILLFIFFFAGRGLTGLVLEKEKAENEYPMSTDIYLLDTYCVLTVYEGGGREALSEAVQALNKYDALMNFNREESDIYKINHRSTDRVSISDDTAGMLGLAREFCAETGGVFEPAIKPVTELWDFKEEKKVPEPSALEAALKKVGSLKWDIEGNEFVAYDKEVKIDAGAIAKGFIADRIREVMIKSGVTSGIINLGGNVLCIGKRPDGSPFSVAIRDPGDENGYAFALELEDLSAVTAGAYERCFVQDGVRYHHIIDPSTGFPARTGLESVSVTGPVSAVCDALSTSLFIMGEDRGKAFLDGYNEAHGGGYSAYFLDEVKAGQK